MYMYMLIIQDMTKASVKEELLTLRIRVAVSPCTDYAMLHCSAIT